jgi:rhamnosyltransferase
VKVAAVIVTYHPEPERLRILCAGLVDSRADVVVVDNTAGGSSLAEVLGSRCVVAQMAGNVGIAAAQNRGIEIARSRGAEFIAFFDQDSAPPRGFLESLSAVAASPRTLRVVAPVCFDARTGEELPSYRLSALGVPSPVYASRASGPVAVDLVISSGSGATMAALDLVGGMDESLFIDQVDFDWCLRCREMGVEILVVPGAVMRHSIGQRVVQLGPLRAVVHGVPRSYFKTRNCLLMLRRTHVPFAYALREFMAAIVQQIVLWVRLPDGRRHFHAFVCGLRDGMRGKGGIAPTSIDPTQMPVARVGQ